MSQPTADRGSQRSAGRVSRYLTARARCGARLDAAASLGGGEDARRLAESQLAEMGEDAVGAALEALRDLPQTRLRQAWSLSVALIVGVAAGAVGPAVVDLVFGESIQPFQGWAFSLFMTGCLLSRWRALRRTASRWLAYQQDPRVLGPLADALAFTSGPDHRTVASALAASLEACDPARFHELTPHQRTCIAGALLTEDAETALSLLRSLMRLRDGSAVAWVERLAAGEGRAKSPEVLQAANECLPDLREAARRATEAMTLLRPASAADPGTLLRPLSGTGDVDTSALPRPVEATVEASRNLTAQASGDQAGGSSEQTLSGRTC